MEQPFAQTSRPARSDHTRSDPSTASSRLPIRSTRISRAPLSVPMSTNIKTSPLASLNTEGHLARAIDRRHAALCRRHGRHRGARRAPRSMARERLFEGDVVVCNHAAVQGQHLNNTVMYTPKD